jgi:D-alanine-D-alanine ligase
VPAKLDSLIDKQVKIAALAAHKTLGCFGCSRVDLILDNKGNPFILEVNTIPGLTATSLLPKAANCIGIKFEELCLQLIKLAYEKAEKKIGSSL